MVNHEGISVSHHFNGCFTTQHLQQHITCRWILEQPVTLSFLNQSLHVFFAPLMKPQCSTYHSASMFIYQSTIIFRFSSQPCVITISLPSLYALRFHSFSDPEGRTVIQEESWTIFLWPRSPPINNLLQLTDMLRLNIYTLTKKQFE